MAWIGLQGYRFLIITLDKRKQWFLKARRLNWVFGDLIRRWLCLVDFVEPSLVYQVFSALTSHKQKTAWKEMPWKWVLAAQSCPTLCDPVERSPSGSSVRGILQARILKWVAISLSRGSSQHRNWTHVSYVSCSTTWEAQSNSHANMYSIRFLGLLSMHLFVQIVLFCILCESILCRCHGE